MSDELEAQRSPHISRSIDNTALQAYMECPWKYLVSMVENRRKGGSTRPALCYGTTWHAIMEAHYKTGGDEQAVISAAIKSWVQHENPDDHRTLERVVSEYGNYLKRWGTHAEETKAWGSTVGFPDVPLIEKATEIWWPGALHPYTGKIDRIIEHQGAYLVEDHKTTSAMGASYFKQFDPSNQMMGYAWLAQKLTGLPIAGVRINAHAVLKASSKFERQTILFSQERLEEWAQNYNSWIRNIERSMSTIHSIPDGTADADVEEFVRRAFPRNFNACAGKYGMCQYTDVCTYPIRIRGKILETEFEDDPWDPMAVEEETVE